MSTGDWIGLQGMQIGGEVGYQGYSHKTNILSRAASNAGCSELTFIKECVRLFNGTPKAVRLTLSINTSHTEHYTGDGSDSSNP